jgi:hypothetical protein
MGLFTGQIGVGHIEHIQHIGHIGHIELIAAFNLYLILFRLSGYELSSDDDEPALQPDDPADSGNALDDMQPPFGPPILQQPPAPTLFDFASFMRRSGGNTTSLQSYEKLMHNSHLDPLLYTVNVLEELRGQYYAY